MIHQDRAISRTRERARDQTHSYWYIPSAPRVNYSLLVMESVGMLKMVTGDGSPLRQGAGTRPRLVFGGYKGLRRRNSRSRLFSGGFSIYRIFWRRSHVRGVSGLSTRQGPTPRGVGAPPTLVGSPGLSWPNSFTPGASFGPEKIIKNWHINWTSFGFPFLQNSKTRRKQKLALGSRLIG